MDFPFDARLERKRWTRGRHGFTLVELLVVVAIVAVLVTASLAAISRARRSGNTVKELNAARNLTTALVSASQDANGVLPYGVDGSAGPISIEETEFRGVRVTGAEAHRYPFRLAPYFGYKFDDLTVIDKSLEKGLRNKDSYMISLLPSLGINCYGVGGYVEPGETVVIPGAVRRVEQAVAPDKMITFCSARLTNAQLGGTVPGYHMVTPRLTPGGSWAGKYDEENAESWGNIDLRHDGKMVAGFLDGSTRLLDQAEVRDMRHWSNEAARLDDPDYRQSSAGTGGGRER